METSEFGANDLDRPNSPTPFEKGVGSPKLIRQKHRLNASVFANKRSRCYATTTDQQIRYCRICERRGSLSSFFSFRLVSLVSSFAKEETREMRQKKSGINESSKTIPFPKTPPFSFSFTMKRRLNLHSL